MMDYSQIHQLLAQNGNPLLGTPVKKQVMNRAAAGGSGLQSNPGMMAAMMGMNMLNQGQQNQPPAGSLLRKFGIM